MTQIKTVCVDKVAYEAVLRNSIRVNDLETENRQLHKFLEEFNALEVAKENKELKELLDSSLETNKALAHRLNICKDLLEECRYIMNIEKDFASCHFEKHKLDDLLTKIDNAIGEK